MIKTYDVYILASGRHGTVYVGVTSDLVGRVHQHRAGIFAGFTLKYEVDRLVWFETHTSIKEAILREKRIKEWKREWKINLIEARNSHWLDLATNWGFEPLPSEIRSFRTIVEVDLNPPPCHPGEGRDDNNIVAGMTAKKGRPSPCSS